MEGGAWRATVHQGHRVGHDRAGRQAGYICPVEGLLGQMVVLVSSFLAAKGVRCKRPEGEQVGRGRGDGEGHYKLCNCFRVCINITPRLFSPSISPKYIPLLSYGNNAGKSHLFYWEII